MRWTRSSSSWTRNEDRPAATTLKGSSGTRSVQLAGRERKQPAASRNHALSSRQFLPRMTRSNSWRNSGWCGCVTRKGLRSTPPCGAVDCSLQRLQRDAVRVVEGGAVARTTLQDQARGEGRGHRLAALVQPRSTALDAGLRQPDAVRAGMACQSTTASQLMNSAMGYGFQGQGQSAKTTFPEAGPLGRCCRPGPSKSTWNALNDFDESKRRKRWCAERREGKGRGGEQSCERVSATVPSRATDPSNNGRDRLRAW